MNLRCYAVRWWSSVEWEWSEVELLAVDETQVRAWVDAETPPEYRLKQDVLTYVEAESLTVKDNGPIELPYVTYRTL